MNSAKKIVIVAALAIVFYFLFSFAESKLIESKVKKTEVLILANDVNKGERLTQNSYKKVPIVTKNIIKYNVDVKKNNIANENLKKGQILYNSFLTSEDKLLKAKENKEIVSIGLKNSDDSVSYKIKKDSIVNLYFSCKSRYLEGIQHSKEILQNDNQEGFTTMVFARNIKILDVVNREGMSKVNQENFIPDTILVEVESSDSKLINILKNIGEFSLTMEQ